MKFYGNYYILTPQEDCLHVKLLFSWDHRVFSEFLPDVVHIYEKHYKGKKWCMLVDSLEWELHTPDVSDLAIDAASQSLIMADHVAQIVGDSVLKKWQVEEMYKEIPETELKTFVTLQDGVYWLNSLGYKFPAT